MSKIDKLADLRDELIDMLYEIDDDRLGLIIHSLSEYIDKLESEGLPDE